jgi:hypothetical protein
MLLSTPINLLKTRDLFGGSSNGNSTFVCARPLAGEVGKVLSIGITAHTLFEYICYASLGLTVISSLYLIWTHLHRYTVPPEQRQIVRIVFVTVFFALIGTLSTVFYLDSIYIRPVQEVYEAFCVAGFLLLCVHYVCPDEDARYDYFNQLENKDKKGNVIPGGSLKWFQVRYSGELLDLQGYN